MGFVIKHLILFAIVASTIAERQIKLEDIERDNLINEKKAAEESRGNSQHQPQPESVKPQLISNPTVLLKPSTFLTPKQLAQYINHNHVYQNQQPQFHTQYHPQYHPQYQYLQTAKKLIYPAKVTTKLVNPNKSVQTTKMVPYYVRPVNYQTLSGVNPLLQPVHSPVPQYYTAVQIPTPVMYQQNPGLPVQTPIIPIKQAAVPIQTPAGAPVPIQAAASVPVASTEGLHNPTQYLYVQPQAMAQPQYLAQPMKINGVPYIMILQADASYLQPQSYNPNLQAIVQAYTPTVSPQSQYDTMSRPVSYDTSSHQVSPSEISNEAKILKYQQELQQVTLNSQQNDAPITTEYRTNVQHRPQNQQVYYLQGEQQSLSHRPSGKTQQPSITSNPTAFRFSVKTKVGNNSPRSLLESYVPSGVQFQYAKFKAEEENLKEQMKAYDDDRKTFSIVETPTKEDEFKEFTPSVQEVDFQSSRPTSEVEDAQQEYRQLIKDDSQKQLYSKYASQAQKKPIYKPKGHQKYVLPRTSSVEHGDGSSSFIDYGAQKFV